MSDEPYIEVVGWDRFQHYRDRDPPWIKLYNRVLENYEYARLRDASKAHLVGIWLLASRTGNRIPVDKRWVAQKIGATEPVDLSALVNAGFIRVCGDGASEELAEGSQDASVRALARGRDRERDREETTLGASDDAPGTDEGAHERGQQPSSSWPLKPRKNGSGQYEYPNRFEAIWDALPERDGSNPKLGAYRAARRQKENENVDPDLLLAAARHYAQHVRDRNAEGRRRVLQAQTFFGPSEPWREFIDPPAPPPPSFGDETARDQQRATEARRRASDRETEARIQAEAEAEQALAELEAWYANLDPDSQAQVDTAVLRRINALGIPPQTTLSRTITRAVWSELRSAQDDDTTSGAAP